MADNWKKQRRDKSGLFTPTGDRPLHVLSISADPDWLETYKNNHGDGWRTDLRLDIEQKLGRSPIRVSNNSQEEQFRISGRFAPTKSKKKIPLSLRVSDDWLEFYKSVRGEEWRSLLREEIKTLV